MQSLKQITKIEEEIFSSIEEKAGQPICRDGIVDYESYRSADFRILFIKDKPIRIPVKIDYSAEHPAIAKVVFSALTDLSSIEKDNLQKNLQYFFYDYEDQTDLHKITKLSTKQLEKFNISKLINILNAISRLHYFYRTADQRQILFDGVSSELNNIALWSYGLFNYLPSFDNSIRIRSAKQKKEWLKQVAFMSLDKRPAYSGTFKQGNDFVLSCRVELNNQIKLYSPEIVIWIGASNKQTVSKILEVKQKNWMRLKSNLQYLLSANLLYDEGLPILNLLMHKVYYANKRNRKIYNMFRSGFTELFNIAQEKRKLVSTDNQESKLPSYFAKYEKAAASFEGDISGLGTPHKN